MGSPTKDALKEWLLRCNNNNNNKAIQAKVRECQVCLERLKVRPWSGETLSKVVKVIVRTLRLEVNAPLEEDELEKFLWVCTECKDELSKLSECFEELERLKRTFHELRGKVGRTLVVKGLGRSEGEWRELEEELEGLEGQDKVPASLVAGKGGTRLAGRRLRSIHSQKRLEKESEQRNRQLNKAE